MLSWPSMAQRHGTGRTSSGTRRNSGPMSCAYLFNREPGASADLFPRTVPRVALKRKQDTEAMFFSVPTWPVEQARARPSGPDSAEVLMQGIPTLLKRVIRRLRRTKCGLETVRTLYLDYKYGGFCGGIKESPYAQQGARRTQSANYQQLSILFKRSGLKITESDVLV